MSLTVTPAPEEPGDEQEFLPALPGPLRLTAEDVEDVVDAEFTVKGEGVPLSDPSPPEPGESFPDEDDEPTADSETMIQLKEQQAKCQAFLLECLREREDTKRAAANATEAYKVAYDAWSEATHLIEEQTIMEGGWESYPLVRLQISEGVKKALRETGIVTMGDLRAWLDEGNDLTDMPGVGQKKADVVLAYCHKFWKD